MHKIIKIIGKNHGSETKGSDVFLIKSTVPETRDRISPARKIFNKVGSFAIFIFKDKYLKYLFFVSKL